MAMAMDISQSPAQGLVNGKSPSPSSADKEKLYDQLLQLRDAVLAGKHAQFQLPPSAVEQLKASLIRGPAPVANSQHDAAVNGYASATNHQQQSQPSSSSAAPAGSLPGLQYASSPTVNGTFARSAYQDGGPVELDPIFLQKSDVLVRTETQLKRQRIERDLQAQVEQRKGQSRDKDLGMDAPPRFDVTLVLYKAQELVHHVSGLKAAGSAASSSFDENDYYSSLVQSDWSSDASSTKGSDRATGAFTDDFERLDGSATKGKRPALPASAMPAAPKNRAQMYTNEPEGVYDMAGDDDDEYTPPDAAAFDASRVHKTHVTSMQHTTPEGDDSDYEPGEITAAETIDPTLRYQPREQMHPPANVPVIRNHLTHIAAPQPNRVSPLTTTKDANIELELVNGRPEIVHKPSAYAQQVSRVSSASPAGHSGPGPSKQRKKQKKRKRDNEPQGRNKRRQRQAEVDTPRSPPIREPYIKDEPISPPPLMANVPPAPQYGYPPYQPPQVDLTGSRPPPQPQYTLDSHPRRQYGVPEPQPIMRVASPAQRPAQRDTQDLRRVASLHHARRPNSPQRNVYSPVAPYRATSMAYGDPRLRAPEPPSHDPRPRSPAVSQRFEDAYASRAASPALMPPPPPPAQPARRIVQDQYGNRYYAADAAQSQATTVRASAVPDSYERAPSRAAYAQPPSSSQYYETLEARMPPPPPPRNQPAGDVEEPFEYTDADGYIVRGYRIRPADRPQPQQPRYSEAPTSPAYQEYRPYEPMPPPPAPQPLRPTQEPTSPTYGQNHSRSYSVHPEHSAAPAQQPYPRQASVAPVQYVPLRQGSVAPTQYAPLVQAQPAAPAPQRAMSVMPGYEYAGAQQQQPQQPQMFVDRYGNPVYPREVREARQGDEYYHT